jgi:hypothetical protein
MFWKQTDEQRLVDVDAADRNQLAAAQKRFEKIQPKFNELMRECLLNQALLNANDQLNIPHTEFELAFMDNLRREHAANIARLNDMTAPVLLEIASAKQRLFNRSSIISGSFANWSYGVLAKLPEGHPAAEVLQRARQGLDAAAQGPMADLLSLWKPLVDAIESDENIDVQIMRFSIIAKQALEVA